MENTNIPKKRRWRRVMRYTIGIAVLSLALFIYVKFFFVFGKGVKSGQLNFIVYKGYVFKTWEGRMIQVGYKSSVGTIQSNEFEFSVVDEKVARQLEKLGGKTLDLHYKEYLGALPCRGMSRYIVDSIVEVMNSDGEQVLPAMLPSGAE